VNPFTGRRSDRRNRLVRLGVLVLIASLTLFLPATAVHRLATGAAQGPQTEGRTPTDSAAGGRALRELIEVLLPPAPHRQTVHLIPGELPASLPLAVPVPSGSRLLGSIVRSEAGATTSMEIVLDAPGAPDDVVAFYDRAFAPQGWHVRSSQSLGDGFLPNLGVRLRSYCTDAAEPAMALAINPTPAGPQDVRVTIRHPAPGRPSFSACAEPFRSHGSAALAPGGPREPFPALYAPPGAQLDLEVRGDRSSRYDGSGGQHQVLIESELGVTELAAHYGDRLRVAGWESRATGAAGDVAWSTWHLTGAEQWQGWFFATAGAASRDRWLSFRMERVLQESPE
jgi:hypothetical protein